MKYLFIVCSLIGILGLSSCASEYERTLKRELASGERYDSLFLGLSLGMSAEDFYKQCWDMNKVGLIKQGPSNMSVQHEIHTFREKAFMNFYPKFTVQPRRIYEMPMEFSYEAWVPWNTLYSSDSLITEVVPLLEKWYGGAFMELTHPDKGTAYVRINGNRRVVVSRKDDQYVKVVITDMTIPDSLQFKPKPGSTAAPFPTPTAN